MPKLLYSVLHNCILISILHIYNQLSYLFRRNPLDTAFRYSSEIVVRIQFDF